jgi:hypothetical protein
MKTNHSGYLKTIHHPNMDDYESWCVCVSVLAKLVDDKTL